MVLSVQQVNRHHCTPNMQTLISASLPRIRTDGLTLSSLSSTNITNSHFNFDVSITFEKIGVQSGNAHNAQTKLLNMFFASLRYYAGKE